MKKILVFSVMLSVILCAPALFAQSAKIIDLKGAVTVKQERDSDWEKAKINTLLYREAEVKTEKKSECTLAFDDEIENILTIKENSHIKLESILPGNIYLPEGRVFSLIDNISKIQNFEIKTPTAIAGVRGTGWLSSFLNNNSSFSCFEDNVNIEGTDSQGKKTGKKNLPAGFGLNVGPGGNIGDLFNLGAKDLKEWQDFKENMQNLKKFFAKGAGSWPGGSGWQNPLGDLKDEHRDLLQDDALEKQRRDDEERRDTGQGELEY